VRKGSERDHLSLLRFYEPVYLESRTDDGLPSTATD
jgi:hypothetical protein